MAKANSIIMETESPVEEIDLTWKINKFSQHIDEIESAVFKPYPNLSSLFSVLIRYEETIWSSMLPPNLQCEILLKKLNNEDILNDLGVGFHLQFIDAEGSVLKKIHNKHSKFSMGAEFLRLERLFAKGTIIDIKNRWIVFKKEKIPSDDTMIVKIRFEFFRLKVTTKSNAAVLMKPHPQNVPVLSADFENLYNSKTLTDITIRIDGANLQAHRAVLIARSSIFKRKLVDSEIKLLTITDVDYDVFDCFLRYLYAGVLKDKTFSVAYRLYSVAEKYGVPSLQEECSEILGFNLNAENVCSVLDLSFAHSDKSLKDKALDFVSFCFNGIYNL